MKTFRHSFWKASSTSTFVLTVISLLALLCFILVKTEYWGEPVMYFVLFMVLMLCLLLCVMCRQYFYLTMDDSACCFRNMLRESWKYSFSYEDIYCINMEHPGGYSNVHIDVYLKGKSGYRRFFIDAIPEADYLPIINAFREKGITVQTRNIDRMIKRTRLPL